MTKKKRKALKQNLELLELILKNITLIIGILSAVYKMFKGS